MAVGTSRFTYQVVEGWGRGPGSPALGLVSAMAVDSQGNVYAFNRSAQASGAGV